MRGRQDAILGVSLLLILSFSACGDDSRSARTVPQESETITSSVEPSPTIAEEPEIVPKGPPDATIRAFDNFFKPLKLTLPPGPVVVRFLNKGETPHTFSAQFPEFDSGNVAPGRSALVGFEMPESGSGFFCELHAGMGGELVAKD